MFVVVRVGDRWKVKPEGKACPHLSFNAEGAVCAVHAEPWFENTPCAVYGNSRVDPDFLSKRGKPCVVGLRKKQQGGLCSLSWISPEEMEDVAPVKEEEEC